MADRWDDLHPELRDLLERAQRLSDSPDAARKHHIVPVVYLERWAERGQIGVTDMVVGRRSYRTKARNALRLTDFYRLSSPDLPEGRIPPLLAELLLGQAEGSANLAFEALLIEGVEAFLHNTDHLFWASFFIALQITRGTRFREASKWHANAFFKLSHSDLSETGIRNQFQRVQGRDPSSKEVQEAKIFFEDVQEGRVFVAPQDAAIVGFAIKAAWELGQRIFLNRTLAVVRGHNFITSDEPVVIIGGPPSSRIEAAGIAEAGVILLPLGPQVALGMFHQRLQLSANDLQEELSWDEQLEINLEIGANARRWIIERPGGRQAQNLPLPTRPSAEGQMERVSHFVGKGELYRSFSPSRWSTSPCPPPWPVARWWKHT